MPNYPFEPLPDGIVEQELAYLPCVGVVVRAAVAEGRPAVVFDFALEGGAEQVPTILYYVPDDDQGGLGALVTAAVKAAVAAVQRGTS